MLVKAPDVNSVSPSNEDAAAIRLQCDRIRCPARSIQMHCVSFTRCSRGRIESSPAVKPHQGSLQETAFGKQCRTGCFGPHPSAIAFERVFTLARTKPTKGAHTHTHHSMKHTQFNQKDCIVQGFFHVELNSSGSLKNEGNEELRRWVIFFFFKPLVHPLHVDYWGSTVNTRVWFKSAKYCMCESTLRKYCNV